MECAPSQFHLVQGKELARFRPQLQGFLILQSQSESTDEVGASHGGGVLGRYFRQREIGKRTKEEEVEEEEGRNWNWLLLLKNYKLGCFQRKKA